MHYLYLITNLINWKMYVGITTNPSLRWCKHRIGFGSRLVKAAITKYGLENLRFHVVYASLDRDCVEWMERQAIAELNTQAPFGYNRNPGGGGSPVGIKQSAETIARRSASNRGKKRSADFGIRVSLSNTGRKRTLEMRKKMSESRCGHPGYQRQREAVSRIMSKPILMDGAAYPSMKIAASQNGLSYSSLHKKFRRYEKSNSFPIGWGYLDQKIELGV